MGHTARRRGRLRRWGLTDATLRVDFASGFIANPLVGLDDANAARDRIIHAVETDRRRAL